MHNTLQTFYSLFFCWSLVLREARIWLVVDEWMAVAIETIKTFFLLNFDALEVSKLLISLLPQEWGNFKYRPISRNLTRYVLDVNFVFRRFKIGLSASLVRDNSCQQWFSLHHLLRSELAKSNLKYLLQIKTTSYLVHIIKADSSSIFFLKNLVSVSILFIYFIIKSFFIKFLTFFRGKCDPNVKKKF